MATGKVGEELKPGSESNLGLSLSRKFCAQEIENCGFRIEPSVGSVMREKIFSNVDLPALTARDLLSEFRLKMPTTSPRLISKDTSFRAQKSSREELKSGSCELGARSFRRKSEFTQFAITSRKAV